MKLRVVVACTMALFTTVGWTSEQPQKPDETSLIAVTKMMNSMVDKGLGLKTCKGAEDMISPIYTPMKYEMRGNVEEDGKYNQKFKHYMANYEIRLWSSNQEGIPIIRDWMMIVQDQKNKDKSEWCVGLMR